MIQLNPTIPVVVVSRENRKGHCIGWVDYSQEHDLIWVVATDDDGQVWCVPNGDIRLRFNYTMGRLLEDDGDAGTGRIPPH